MYGIQKYEILSDGWKEVVNVEKRLVARAFRPARVNYELMFSCSFSSKEQVNDVLCKQMDVYST